jgi:hypothetical protein
MGMPASSATDRWTLSEKSACRLMRNHSSARRESESGRGGLQSGERRTLAFLDRAQLLPVDLGPRDRQRVDVGGPGECDVNGPGSRSAKADLDRLRGRWQTSTS